MKQNIGIYVHIPFCEKKCDYCNFISFKTDDETKEKYVEYLLKEIGFFADKLKDYQIDTIFIGGGTPSTLRHNAIRNILNYITNNFDVASDAEITIEANPNSLTKEKLSEYKLAGVNRLSVGLQTYNDKLLKLIGRIHTCKEFDEAIKKAKSLGFENISADILLGLPTQKMRDVKNTLKHLLKLNLKHISAYGLIVEENTPLSKNLEKNIYSLPSEKLSLKMYEKTASILKKHGINRYEVSNFSKAGFESKHNLKYWTMQEYIGFGLSAHSFFDGKRWENTSNLNEYFDALDNNNLPQSQVEAENIESLKEEFVMTELRKENGFSLKKYENFFGTDILIEKQNAIAKLLNLGLISVENERLFATEKGFEVLNQIILELS